VRQLTRHKAFANNFPASRVHDREQEQADQARIVAAMAKCRRPITGNTPDVASTCGLWNVNDCANTRRTEAIAEPRSEPACFSDWRDPHPRDLPPLPEHQRADVRYGLRPAYARRD